VAFGAVSSASTTWAQAVLLAWDAAAAVYLISVWTSVSRLDAAKAKDVAASEDNSRTSSETLLLSASVASLVAVGFVLAEAGRADAGGRGALSGLAVGSVLLAWAVVHTIFALRYARLFYTAPWGDSASPKRTRPATPISPTWPSRSA
jgi:uncharacterized membrane protein